MTDFQPELIRRGARQILEGIGLDPDSPEFRETPERMANMYREIFSGLFENPSEHLKARFNETYHETILVRDITFFSMCEEHLLPFFGRAHIGYIPNGDILGISKLARITEVFTRRPQMQERATNQIADCLHQEYGASGVYVILEAQHTCMMLQGVRRPESRVVTSALRGIFADDRKARSEVLSLIQAPRRHV